jgi:3-hydroxybutyryl-CoA dehydrogenase
MSVAAVGVVGAGVMGVGVAESLARAGFAVVLIDVSDEALARARRQLAANARFHRLFRAGGTDAQPVRGLMDRIECSTDYAALGRADFVIENVTEKFEIKRQVYASLDRICPAHCIFGVNTSAIPITRIGGCTARPDRVVGMHFMNPVPMKPLVEVIRGYHTSDATLDGARALLRRMGKDCVVVNDAPGFVSNRVLMLTVNEAAFLVHEGVASVEDVDRIFRECFQHRMGPLETADLIGLDTILYSIEALYESLSDSKYRPCPLLRKMVDAGLHGRKNGKGFYDYEPAAAARVG